MFEVGEMVQISRKKLNEMYGDNGVYGIPRREVELRIGKVFVITAIEADIVIKISSLDGKLDWYSWKEEIFEKYYESFDVGL